MESPNLNNLEKLIQLATIEHMYNMLNNMRNTSISTDINDTKNEKQNPLNYKDNTFDFCSTMNNNHNKIIGLIEQINSNYSNLNIRLNKIESIVQQVYDCNTSINNSEVKLNDSIVKGQQKITKFMKNNIELKIEELDDDVEFVEIKKEKELHIVDEEDEDEEDEDEEQEQHLEEESHPNIVTCSDNDIEEESSSEEEVGTEDNLSDIDDSIVEDSIVEDNKEDSIVPIQNEIEEIVEMKKFESEEQEQEEEVFEIDIDDVTYYATGEENGVLYEVEQDGEVGKKVGIIKDGEPIFD
jgi:hypothetical protein